MSLLGPRLGVSLWPLRAYFYHFFQSLQLPFREILFHWTLSRVWVTVTGGPASQPRAGKCTAAPPHSALRGANRLRTRKGETASWWLRRSEAEGVRGSTVGD